MSEPWVYREAPRPPRQERRERGPGFTQVTPPDRWQPPLYDPDAHLQRLNRGRPQPPEPSSGTRPHQAPPQPPYERQPQYAPQPGFVPQPQFEPQPGYAPQAQYAPQPQYAPQAQYAPQPQYAPSPQYPRQPQYGPPPAYAPGPPPPRRRGSHATRNVIAALAGLTAAIIVISVAVNNGHSVQTASSTAETGGAPHPAGIGSAITLSGNTSGEQMVVTVVRVIGSAKPGDVLTSAPAGDRLYAVQFRLADTGKAAYSDAPSNGAVVVDASGQAYQSALTDTAAGCASFPGAENIAPGSSGLGCIVFEVPKASKIVSVQFTLDSGTGPQTGQWTVG